MYNPIFCIRSLFGVSLIALSLGLCSPAWAQNVQAKDLVPNVAQAAGQSGKPSVGMIKVVTGLVNLQTADGKNKFAGAGTKLNVGDIINTQAKSTTVLEFVDTTQVALRPNTRFVVENYEYQPEQPIADKAEFKLVKGGLRTLTGLIGKRGSADAFSLKSETATIGIRGTDFTARLCKGDECARLAKGESDKATVTNTSNADVAGRVSQLTGETFAVSPEGKRRPLQKGAAVFAGDAVDVSEGGFAVLSMADSTRLTLPGGSSMQLAAYRYAPASPQTSIASFKLLKGAVRAVTGAIAKAEPNNVKFFTETATVGIRGTALDVSCTSASGGLVVCSGASSLTVELRNGQLIVTSGGVNSFINAGQSAIIPAGSVNIQVLNSLPNVLGNVPNSGPLPENTPANFESLSSTPVQSLQQDGSSDENSQLFVAVNDGVIVISNSNQDPLEVNRGEGAFVQTLSNLPPQLLTAPPDVIVEDNTLASPAFTAPQCAQ
ncbi:FecR family protein [Limnobacter sp.]|uniref:FecR family protein n=1 Tax=Limnobacter sp. TaxID=2003368 RepID=UPI002FE08227